MRLQILSTEHWSLLASRSLAWNESFSRAGMFLTTLSGAIVALGLVGGATGFGEAFTLFALVILPVVLFIGVATYIRLGASNYHEALCVIGMNRIRAAYLELAPDLERFFVMSGHDDRRGIGITMGVQPGGGTLFWIAQIVAGTPTVIMILNAVIAGRYRLDCCGPLQCCAFDRSSRRRSRLSHRPHGAGRVLKPEHREGGVSAPSTLSDA